MSQRESEDRPSPSERGGSTPPLSQSDRQREPFDPEVLDKTVIAIPLLHTLEREKIAREADPNRKPIVYQVIIDVNLMYRGGRDGAQDRVRELVREVLPSAKVSDPQNPQGINETKSGLSDQYLYAALEGELIRQLVTLANGDGVTPSYRAIYHLWPDFPVKALIHKSVTTVKADAARISFSALGEGIVWAVLDSGIDKTHPHFKLHGNQDLPPPLEHRDFTVTIKAEEEPQEDKFGHGTHVAGIIAGEMKASTSDAAEADLKQKIRAGVRYRDEHDEIKYDPLELSAISGMAPKCKLLSLKVLDHNGDGVASNLIAAIEYIQRINGYGRRIRIHGVNMSVGYDFDPEWFACGQSPLCVEVDRLVRSGVVVVVAAGNTGYGWVQSAFKGSFAAGMDLTINDPGNDELAITVGSTHRDMPHVYGVSYFSSKGPTGDGRAKPDVVAPGEKILSCAVGEKRAEAKEKLGADCDYVEASGTSMAAPHVSGVIAAFLSVRSEFIGNPEAVKKIFLSTATDLKRDRHFQGYGLVDLMRAIQSV